MKHTGRTLSIFLITALVLTIGLFAPATQAARVKDIASIAGVRSNQLIGYGLVVGLDGSGDQTSQTPFTVQTFENMLTQGFPQRNGCPPVVEPC